MKRFLLLLLAIPLAGALSSCSSQVEAKRPVSYHFESGKTAMLQGGLAYAPRNAPEAVKRAVAALSSVRSGSITFTAARTPVTTCRPS